MEKEKNLNTFSIVAFIFSFLLFPVGLILSIIGIVRCKKYEKENEIKLKYKVFNIVGLIISILEMLLISFVIIFIIFILNVVKSHDNEVLGSYTCDYRYSSLPVISANFNDGKFIWSNYYDSNNVVVGTYKVNSRQINNKVYTYKLSIKPNDYKINNNININTSKSYNITIVKNGNDATITFENGTTYNCHSVVNGNEF